MGTAQYPPGFDPDTGWEELVGYHTFSSTMRSLADTEWLASAGLRVQKVGPGFRAIIRGIRFNRYSISHIRTTAPLEVVWERRRETAIRRTVLNFIESGTVVVSEHHAGKLEAFDYGGLVIVLPGTDYVTFSLSGSTDLIWFSFDSMEIEDIPARARLNTDVVADSTLFRAAHAFLKVLAYSSRESSMMSATILRGLTRDFAQALSREVFAPEHGSVVEAVQAMVDGRATDPRFSVSRMATELGISRRTLERECAKAHWSPGDELRKARTRIAFDALMSRPHKPLREIARASGFGSIDALHRCIKVMYGDTPSAFRRSAVSG